MNEFDAVVAAFAIFAIVTGFMSGLLRSLATILGYLIAAALTPQIMPFVLGHFTIPTDWAWAPFFVVFVVVGIVVGALCARRRAHLPRRDAGGRRLRPHNSRRP